MLTVGFQCESNDVFLVHIHITVTVQCVELQLHCVTGWEHDDGFVENIKKREGIDKEGAQTHLCLFASFRVSQSTERCFVFHFCLQLPY